MQVEAFHGTVKAEGLLYHSESWRAVKGPGIRAVQPVPLTSELGVGHRNSLSDSRAESEIDRELLRQPLTRRGHHAWTSHFR